MPMPAVTAPAVTLESGNDTKFYFNASTSPVAADQVPVVGEISYTPSGSTEQIPIQSDDGWDRAVKNGQSVTLTFRTLAPASDAVVAALLTAAESVGANAQGLGTLELPDGKYRSGAWIVQQAVPTTPPRGVFGYQFTLISDGTITSS